MVCIEELIEILNKRTKKIYESRKQYILSQLKNDVQKILFLDWWNSGKIYDKRYKNGLVERYKYVTTEDYNTVYGFIMETISMGMG